MEALSLFDSIVEEIEKDHARAWLQKHQPESYDQLIRKVEQARVGLAPSGAQSSPSLSVCSSGAGTTASSWRRWTFLSKLASTASQPKARRDRLYGPRKRRSGKSFCPPSR